MARIAQNLLKLVDFPFSYSLLSVYLLSTGKPIFEKLSLSELAFLLPLIGLVGTALAIIDPFGRLIKKIIRISKLELPARLMARLPENTVRADLAEVINEIARLKQRIDSFNVKQGEKPEEIRSLRARLHNLETVKDGLEREIKTFESLKVPSQMIEGVEETRWISPDAEKTVGMFYFASILIAILIVLSIPNATTIFLRHFAVFTDDTSYIIPLMQGLIIAGLGGVGYSIWSNIRKMVKHSGIVTVYLNGRLAQLEQEYQAYLDAIKNEMDTGDWAAANNYTTVLEFGLTKTRYRRIP